MMLWFTFPENGVNFVTQNLQKTEKCSPQAHRTLVFEFKIASNLFSKKTPMTKF